MRGESTRGPADSRRKYVALGAGLGLAVVLLALGLAFTSAENTRQVTDNARRLHWANSVVGHAAVTRAAVTQAVFFSIDQADGSASGEATARANAEAVKAFETFTSVAGSGETAAFADDQTTETIAAFTTSTESVLAALEADDPGAAFAATRQLVDPAFSDLESQVISIQASLEERIEDTEAQAGQLAGITRLLVTLLVPTAALVVYRWLIVRQVRERRIHMDAKLEAERRLNQAKDEFIAGLSHEFRTPLTSIYGFSEILIDSGLVDPESSLELVGLINAESAELSRMVEDLLVAARLEANALSISPLPVSLQSEVEAAVAPLIRTGTDISLRFDDRQVWADPLRLRQVLRNLISNAIRHGGPTVGVSGRVEGGVYVCSVSDDGPGVADAIAERLFERFIHEGREALLAGSVGLGLNIARSLIEAMGGELAYQRQDGWTHFTFSLPLAPSEGALAGTLASATAGTR